MKVKMKWNNIKGDGKCSTWSVNNVTKVLKSRHDNSCIAWNWGYHKHWCCK